MKLHGNILALLHGNKIFFLIKCSACLMNEKKKYFKKIIRLNRFQELIMKDPLKNKTFEESSKSRGVFRTHASIYDGAFLLFYT